MRIVALSDLHGHLPEIPPCDLLLIAGDICPDIIDRVPVYLEPERQARWFDKCFRPWLAAAPARYRVATWGNHDWCGEVCDFTADGPGSASLSLTRLVLLNDEKVRVQELTVWGSPWSRTFGEWAFMRSPSELEAIYARIPAGIDILMSHQPPYGYGDVPGSESGREEHAGSKELLATIERVRPKLVVCGHIHEGYGRYEHDGIPILNVSV